MIRYGDYFSRKELFYLGVNPNQELGVLNSDYNVENKYDKVSKGIKEIYEYLKTVNNHNLRGKALETREDILNNKVERRLVAAFYDLGILEEKDLNKFPLDYKIDNSKNSIDEIDISSLDYDFVKKIQLTDIYEYLSYMNTVRKNSAATRARKVACLRSYFKYMHGKAKYIDDNPTKELESPKLKQSLPNYLTLDECKVLLETVIKNSTGYRDYAIITLFLNCGMRLSELVGINISDIRGDRLTVTGKGNKQRTVYLNEACKDAIKAYMEVRPKDNVKDRRALFLSKQKSRISNNMVYRMIKKNLIRAGLDPEIYSPHKLRHTAATLMYKYGNVDIRSLQEILGHESIGTTEIYTHVDNYQTRQAIEKANRDFIPLDNCLKGRS